MLECKENVDDRRLNQLSLVAKLLSGGVWIMQVK